MRPLAPGHAYVREMRLDRDDIPRALAELEQFCKTRGVPSKTMYRLQVAVDEVVANILKHGFPDSDAADSSTEPRVILSVALETGALAACVEDNGAPFNLIEDAPEPDFDLDLESMPVGGLGVHIVKALTGELTYDRIEGRNRLVLRQPLDHFAEPSRG